MAKERPIPVSFSREQKEILGKFRGKIGDSEPEIVRNIVVMWLFENSYFEAGGKNMAAAARKT